MWRKFHILSRVQVFVLSTVCASVIASSCAIALVRHDETAILRDLFWPHQSDAFINFGVVFVSLIPLFLGYYHLGRIGALVSLAVSAMTFFAIAFCAFFLFAPHAGLFGTVAYISACLLLCVLLFLVHMKASNSDALRNAQRLLRLISNPQTP